jgi:hypothetical protein
VEKGPRYSQIKASRIVALIQYFVNTNFGKGPRGDISLECQRFRKNHGWTQVVMAEEVGIDRSFLAIFPNSSARRKGRLRRFPILARRTCKDTTNWLPIVAHRLYIEDIVNKESRLE